MLVAIDGVCPNCVAYGLIAVCNVGICILSPCSLMKVLSVMTHLITNAWVFQSFACFRCVLYQVLSHSDIRTLYFDQAVQLRTGH